MVHSLHWMNIHFLRFRNKWSVITKEHKINTVFAKLYDAVNNDWMESWIKFRTTVKISWLKYKFAKQSFKEHSLLAIMCHQTASLISTNELFEFLQGLQNALNCSLYHCHSLFDFISNYIIVSVSVIILNCNALAFFMHCTQANGNFNHCILIFCLHSSDSYFLYHAIVSLHVAFLK